MRLYRVGTFDDLGLCLGLARPAPGGPHSSVARPAPGVHMLPKEGSGYNGSLPSLGGPGKGGPGRATNHRSRLECPLALWRLMGRGAASEAGANIKIVDMHRAMHFIICSLDRCNTHRK